jgi:hypothetical protein
MQKKKTRPAPWVGAFQKQAQSLRPENSAVGGIRSRSQPEAQRMQVYSGIVKLFLLVHRLCRRCGGHELSGLEDTKLTVHHTHGREGMLLFDVRYWIPLCLKCHQFVGRNVEQSRAAGYLCDKGDWGKL